MKRFPKIIAAVAAALALTASLALAADAVAPKAEVPSTQVQCPGAVSGQMGAYGPGRQAMLDGSGHWGMRGGSGRQAMHDGGWRGGMMGWNR